MRIRTISLAFVPAILLGAVQIPALAQTPPPPVLSTVPSPPDGTAPQPFQMSGLPLQVGDLPPGVVTVRVIRGSFADNIANQRVQLHIGQSGRVLEAITDPSGRAQFSGLAAGDVVQARADVRGEILESQQFALPDQGGVRVVLVAIGNGAVAASAFVVESKSVVLFVLIGAFIGVAASIVRPSKRRGVRPQE